MKELQKAQVKNFAVAQKDLEKRLSLLRSSESKKIQAPRQELKKRIEEYNEKLRVLNLRLQAGDALQGDSKDITSQLESSLEEAHEENRSLKDKVMALQKTLNEIFRTGAIAKDNRNAPSQEIRSAPSKDDRNPATPSSRGSSASMGSV